jgi:O-antigen/teichoic acid export membrane protein
MTRNLFYSTISAGSAVLLLLLLILAGRFLGVGDFGDFSWVISVATIAETFMDLGLHQVTIRAIARDANDAGRLFYTSLILKALPGVGMVAVFTIAVFLLDPKPAVRLASVLMLGSAVMRSYLLTARGVLQGLERFGHDALVTVLDRVVLLVGCGVALWHGAGLVAVSAVFLAARTATTVGALVLTRTHVRKPRFDRALWPSLPVEALPIGVFLLVLNLYNRIDMVMLGPLRGNVETALYGAAYPLYEGATYAAAVVSAVLVPRLSRLWSEDRAAYSRLVRSSVAATLALGVAIALVAWPLAGVAVRFIYPAHLEPATRTVRLLVLGLPFIYVIWVLHAVAISAFQTRALVVVTAIGTAINVGLNAWLIPAYGYNGAAIATVLSEGLVLGLLLQRLWRAIWRSAPAGP